MKEFFGKSGVVAALIVLALVAFLVLPAVWPSLSELFFNRWGWLTENKLGTAEQAYEWQKEQIPPPSLDLKTQVSGNKVTISAVTDPDCVLSVDFAGETGQQSLTKGTPRRFRVSRSGLPDGQYTVSAKAERCKGVSGKAKDVGHLACVDSQESRSFVIDTVLPQAITPAISFESGALVIEGKTQDLSGLKQACLGGNCVVAKENSYHLEVSLRAVNESLARYGALRLELTDRAGNHGTADFPPPVPKSCTLLVDARGRVRSISIPKNPGIWGWNPEWTWLQIDDGQIIDTGCTPAVWYWGIRVIPVILIVVIIVLWRLGVNRIRNLIADILEYFARVLGAGPHEPQQETAQ